MCIILTSKANLTTIVKFNKTSVDLMENAVNVLFDRHWEDKPYDIIISKE